MDKYLLEPIFPSAGILEAIMESATVVLVKAGLQGTGRNIGGVNVM